MKKEIVERLLKAGSINFDEALILMEKAQIEMPCYPTYIPPIQQTYIPWKVGPFINHIVY